MAVTTYTKVVHNLGSILMACVEMSNAMTNFSNLMVRCRPLPPPDNGTQSLCQAHDFLLSSLYSRFPTMHIFSQIKDTCLLQKIYVLSSLSQSNYILVSFSIPSLSSVFLALQHLPTCLPQHRCLSKEHNMKHFEVLIL